MTDAALVVFARPPHALDLKTRLAPCCSLAERQRLYAAFLRDTLALAQTACGAVPADLFVYLADPEGGAGSLPSWLAELTPRSQVQGDLGIRLRAAASDLRGLGYRRIVIMGSDSPTLPATVVRSAFEKLVAVDLVIGPADDGGYYLIGLSPRSPLSLFDAVPWSTDRVLQATVHRAAEAGLTFRLLPEHYDVDECADLKRLVRELARFPRHAPQTVSVIQDLPVLLPAAPRRQKPHC